MAKPILTRNRLILLGIILSFFIIPYLFMTPLLEGKKLLTTDLTQYMGMEKEISNYRKETGKEALWTNSMFCGMPAYLISVKYPGNLFTSEVHSFTRVTYPAGMIIIYLIGFFILLRSLKLNKWLSLIGAFAYAFSSYFIIIIAAGHTSKAYAIGYLPIVAAGTLMVYRGKHFPGFLLFTFGLMLEILATHYQITYYGLILLLIYVVVEFIYSLREKRLAEFVKRSLFLVGGAIIAVGVNFANLYSVYEYSKETVRGPSELTREKQNRTTGLNKDYAVLWSQGIDETLTLLIPDFKGGSTDAHPGRESESYKIMKEHRLNDINENLTRIYLYHGEKPGTAGAIYVGAVIMFLFFVGLFILKGRLKWWLLAVAIISIVMSWGKNIMWLTGFLLDHLPFYNKFRAPDMILVITEFAIPLLAIMALHKIFFGDTDKKELYRGLKWSFIITGGITLFFSIFPGIFDNFHSPLDYIQGKPSSPDWLMAAIYQDRKNLLRDDALRSFILILLSAVLLYFAVYKQKIKSGISIALLGVLIVVDLWQIDKRYLNSNNFVVAREKNDHFKPTVADTEILKDTSLYYRVLPLIDAFSDTHYSYYHKNVGGYHAAKLNRPNELMNRYLVNEMESLLKNIQQNPSIVNHLTLRYKLMCMLNARYIIYDDNKPPIVNPYTMGNAWFVKKVELVENADAEFDSIRYFDPLKTALVDKRFSDEIQNQNFTQTQSDRIVLTEYEPNDLKYEYETQNDQFVIFSEIYYDKGWDAFIDGEKAPYVRANYILRGMSVPAGKHTIEFKFEPKSYFIGNKVSLASSLLLILAIVGYGISEFRKWRKKE